MVYAADYNMYCIANTSKGGVISFGSPVRIYSNEYDHFITSTTAGDIDTEGKPDIVIANSGTAVGSYAILRNTSTTTAVSFAATDVVNTGLPSTCSLGDMDGVGKPDLLMTLETGGIAIATNTSSTGNVSFNKTVRFPNVTNNTIIAAGDFNSDSKNDLALGYYSYDLEILPNTTGEEHLIAGGPTTFCQGDAVTLNSTAGLGNQWYKNGIAIPGASTSTLHVTTSGLYTDTVRINGTATFASIGTTVTVNSIPAKPTISRDINGNLISSSASGNQWYKDSVRINGATGQTYHPAIDASYGVQVTEKNCASQLSDRYNFLVTGIVHINGQGTVNIYPNPVHKEIIVYYNLPFVSGVTAELYDVMGTKLFTKSISSGYNIDVSTLPDGNYFLKLVNKINHKLIYSTHVIKIK